ncbi:hypothetical protein ACLB2K_071850 [Fragaria x ananassa]
MKSIEVFVLLAMFMALTIPLLATSDEETPAAFPMRGRSRFLATQTPRPVTSQCSLKPGTCTTKGSPGPNCCNNRCVDMGTDKNNCGSCGKKCKITEICCKGHIVNPMTDNFNCGSCFNSCKVGSSCENGMCDYA